MGYHKRNRLVITLIPHCIHQAQRKDKMFKDLEGNTLKTGDVVIFEFSGGTGDGTIFSIESNLDVIIRGKDRKTFYFVGNNEVMLT